MNPADIGADYLSALAVWLTSWQAAWWMIEVHEATTVTCLFLSHQFRQFDIVRSRARRGARSAKAPGLAPRPGSGEGMPVLSSSFPVQGNEPGADPRARNAAPTRLSRGFEAAARWGEALQGQGQLATALALLRDATGAEIATLAHFSGPGIRGLHIVSTDRSEVSGRRDLPADLCEPLVRGQIGRGRAGSVWRYSDIVDGLLVTPGSRLTQWFRANRITEVCAILLSSERDGAHVLNLLFALPPSAEVLALLDALAPALAGAWDRRNPAVLPASRRSGLSVVGDEAEEAPLLGVGNPAGLTRAEFRICALLSEGVAARDLPEALGISESTLRSHLRNIYAKTETTGQAGLIHRLMKHAAPAVPLRAG